MDPRESYGETRRQLSVQTCITPSQSSTRTSFQQTLITFHQIQRILIPVLCCMSLRNEAVIKMIITGRSPTMRHVSRTHRVVLTVLILIPKFKSVTLTPKHQLEDVLTKGNFTRDEWNNLLHLFNISHFSSTCCAKTSSLISCSNTMAKRMQEQIGEELWQNRNLQPRTCLITFRQVPHPRKVRLRPKVGRYSQLRGNPKSR